MVVKKIIKSSIVFIVLGLLASIFPEYSQWLYYILIFLVGYIGAHLEIQLKNTDVDKPKSEG